MIPFDFTYIRPQSSEEAVTAYRQAKEAGNAALYLSGGTEIVTMARDRKLTFDVLIDLKRLPECRGIDRDQGEIRFGSAVSLNDAQKYGNVPLLSMAAGAVADHSVRNSITVGGNIAGRLPYREAVLPFLLFDGTVEIAGPDGNRNVGVMEIFDKRLKLSAGEFLVALRVPESASESTGYYRRRQKDSRVDYPIMTLCMARHEDGIRAATSGVFGFPVRSRRAEKALSASGTPAERSRNAVEAFDGKVQSNMRGAADYRRALLLQAMEDGLRQLEG